MQAQFLSCSFAEVAPFGSLESRNKDVKLRQSQKVHPVLPVLPVLDELCYSNNYSLSCFFPLVLNHLPTYLIKIIQY